MTVDKVKERPLTIAEQLHGKVVDETKVDGPIIYDPTTLTHTFSDGSKGRILTTFVDCSPYITASLSTLAKKPVKIWRAI